jgi:two-component system, OmpR family, response regulator RstA
MEASSLATHLSASASPPALAHAAARRVVHPRVCYIGHETAQWMEIRRSIEQRNIDVCDALNFDEVVEQYSRAAPDLIIVSENGESLLPHEVCSDLRRRGYSGPVLVITGANDPVDRILALENGADAWAATDIDPRTAVAQVRALLRRSDKLPTSTHQDDGVSSLKVGDCQLSSLSRECMIGGQLVHMAGREFQLLWILAIRAGKVVSREEMARLLGPPDVPPTGRAVDCYVARVRRRLGHSYGKYIKTIHAAGYMLCATSLADQALVVSDA